jgi:hypothetical protein
LESDSLEEAQFESYALKVSKMKGWRLAGELADQLETFDDLKSECAESAVELKKTSRKIEIITKENSKRKKY